MARIAVCIPSYGSVEEKFWIAFTRMVNEMHHQDNEFIILSLAGQPTDYIRNCLVSEALNRDCDYVWFIDSDMIPSFGIFNCLFHMYKDISSALCFQRERPHYPAVRVKETGILLDIPENKIIQVEGIGLACCIISTEVFKKIEQPWFKFEMREGKRIGEDIYFCEKARKAGFEIFVHTGVTCAHYGTEVTLENYLYYKDLLNLGKEHGKESC